MSKKSRKRNKKILGVLGALGAAALLGRKGTAQGVSGSDKAKFTTDAAYSPAPVTGTNYPGANKAAVASAKKSAWPYRSSRSSGDYGVVTAPKRVKNVLIKGRNNAEMGRNIPFDPSQGNLYKPSFTMQGDTRGWKSGGRVKGAGIAKRGVGRAMKKGRK